MVTKASTLLRRAKKRIKDGDNTFICLALIDCAVTRQENQTVQKIVSKIDSAIGTCGSVTGWLVNFQGVPDEQINEHTAREYRLRWLDHLIQTYKGAGQ